jgi:hypothetical protein
VVHDGGDPAEHYPLGDLVDGEAVVLIVDQGHAGRAAGDEDAPTAAATLSNQAAINSAVSRGTSATDGGVAHAPAGAPARRPAQAVPPTSASRSAQSGGAHTSTSAPECPQPRRECHQRFDAPARVIGQQQQTHFVSLIP